MANHHGSEGEVYVGSNQLGELVEFSVNESAEYDEDTALADVWKTTHATARKEWSGQLMCHFDETDTNGQEALLIGASVTLNLRPEGTATGNRELTGTARVNGVEVSVVRPGVVSRRVSFEGSGALTHQNQS